MSLQQCQAGGAAQAWHPAGADGHQGPSIGLQHCLTREAAGHAHTAPRLLSARSVTFAVTRVRELITCSAARAGMPVLCLFGCLWVCLWDSIPCMCMRISAVCAAPYLDWEGMLT